jgi:hypothetical protein
MRLRISMKERKIRAVQVVCAGNVDGWVRRFGMREIGWRRDLEKSAVEGLRSRKARRIGWVAGALYTFRTGEGWTRVRGLGGCGGRPV